VTLDAHIIQGIAERRRRRLGRRRAMLGLFAAMIVALFAVTLVLGQSFTPPLTVLRVLTGQDAGAANFLVGTLRLPRAVMAILAGFAFGLGGVVFQVMLRNPLASPDIIGISSGSGAAAVIAIIVFSLSGPIVSLIAVVAGLGVAVLIYLLAVRNGAAGTRLILVGIGVAAMMNSIIAYVLASAPAWNLQEALRWLSGSLNGSRLADAYPLLAVLVVLGGVLFSQRHHLEVLRMGDDTAAALGVRVVRTRILVILAAVGMIASATSLTGPIAFVAFLSGPIAARVVGGGGSLLLPAALVGAVLTLAADYAGQFLLGSRLPVGVVTGALGAPYLLYLIVRINRSGRSL
jgi:iron complex transport system permease protein